MGKKKTYAEKMRHQGDLPKVEDISGDPKAVARYGGTKLMVPSPMMCHDIMAQVPVGKVITVPHMRRYLAAKAQADATCPLTAGIFVNICANAAAENEADAIPYWRTLKADGELNGKYPEGMEGQRLRLEMEGHRVVQRGKRQFVEDLQESLWEIDAP